MQTPRNARRRNRKSGKSILDDIRSASESEISIIEPVDPNHRGRPHKKASLLNSQYNKK